MTNCVNCGAPLEGLKCEYCGTEYLDKNTIRADFSDENMIGDLIIGGVPFKVRLSSVDIDFDSDVITYYRDNAAVCSINARNPERTFTLKEVFQTPNEKRKAAGLPPIN